MKKINLVLALYFVFSAAVCGQKKDEKAFYVTFWNLENLFDTEDDPIKDDAEFLPLSERKWDEEKLNTKLTNLGTAINAFNNDNGPDVLGFAESENEAILTRLVKDYIKNSDYQIVYKESPDARGIDCGFIFKKSKFEFVAVEGLEVILEDKYPTRLILKVTLKHESGENITFFVNHWPSRVSGQEKSEKNRISAAATLKAEVDKLLAIDNQSKIIIMGDFNDEPSDVSISKTLGAKAYDCNSKAMNIEKLEGLYNLASNKKTKGEGSLKYRDQWNMLDQIIVSWSLRDGKGLDYLCDSFDTFHPEYMMQKEGKYKGSPFPTFGGKKYLGGYSDHFPATAKFVVYP